ncbi:MAG: transketolase [Kiritimatiellae bacterium]|nr:transketolase [Kiritimatiellia bacterium]
MSKLSQGDLVLVANTIRGLATDGVQAAKSGHPGLPMGMADVAAVLWLNHLKHDPARPDWADRDRFVLSGGHGSMLLYSLLHLSGYGLPLDELKRFRQLGSLTPGHPEAGHTVGVETTTGPLGQGIANAVGMALAERMLAARVNTDAGFTPVNHHTFVFCGDGDLMEGLSHEACSLAGHLALERLVLFFDSNKITIEGGTSLSCSDDAKRRFQAYGWRVLEIDGHDYEQIDRAIRKALKPSGAPVVIICRTTIGKGSPNKAGSHESHGAPLGEEEVKLSKRALGLPEDQFFYVPERVRELFAARATKLHNLSKRWERDFASWSAANPEQAVAWRRHMQGELPENLESVLPVFDPAKPVATRSASGIVINALAKAMPQLVGGSADLAPSTMTLIKEAGSVKPGNYSGRNLHFGIREHAMASLLNGMALHGGFRVFGATFFVFLDYCRPSVRLAAIMGLPVIYVFTHDSFYVGEDGPTHEPVEQMASLRCMPNMTTIRPADPTETAAAWVAALKNTKGPTALLLTRQNMAVLDRTIYPAASNLERGAYTLWQSGAGTPELILIGSGSEVELVLAAARQLAGVNVRVVSMPSWELFERQTQQYRDSVLDPACKRRLAAEAGVAFGWRKYIGCKGATVTLDRFGASGPYKDLAKTFGFTVENVVAQARKLLEA